MQSYEKSAEGISRIIGEAAKNQLGILALMIISVGILAYLFFRAKLTPKNIRLILICRSFAFLLIFSGACAFGWAVVQTLPHVAAPPAPANTHEGPLSEPPRKPEAPQPVPDERNFRVRLVLARQYAGVGLSGQSATVFHQLAVPGRYRSEVDQAVLANAESAYRRSRFDDACRAFVTAYQRIQFE